MKQGSRQWMEAEALARLVMLEGPFQSVRVEASAHGALDFIASTHTGLPLAVFVTRRHAPAPLRALSERYVAASMPVYVFLVDTEKREIEYRRADSAQRPVLGRVSLASDAVGAGKLRVEDLNPLLRDAEQFHLHRAQTAQGGATIVHSPPEPTRIPLSAEDEEDDTGEGPDVENGPEQAESFELRLLRSSVPIRKLSDSDVVPRNPVPVGYASSCLVRYRGVLVLLSVAHGLRKGRWAIEIDADYEAAQPQTRLKPLSSVEYMSLVKLSENFTAEEIARTLDGAEPERFSEIDFALKPFKPGELDRHPKLQMILGRTESGDLEIGEAPRLVIASGLDDEPIHGNRYGFAGMTRARKDSQGPTTTIEFRTECVTDLQFVSHEGDFFYRFRSQDKKRRFDQTFRGCSGAPILDEDGTLVSLVVEGSDERDLFGINLRRLRSTVEATLQSSRLVEPLGRLPVEGPVERGRSAPTEAFEGVDGDPDDAMIAAHSELDPWRDPSFFKVGSRLTGRVEQVLADSYVVRIPGPLLERLDRRQWEGAELGEGEKIRVVIADSDARARRVQLKPYSRRPLDAKVRRTSPKGLENCLARGDRYFNAGELDAAIREYHAAMNFAQGKRAAAVWLKLGAAFALQGDRDEAIATFNKALKLESGLAAALANRGIARQEQGDLEHAFEDLSRAIELQKRAERERAHAHNGLGVVLERRGELHEALREYDRAIELDARLPQVWSNRAGAKESLGDLDGAIEDCTKAITRAPHRPAPYRIRARVLFQKAVAGEAQVIFRSIADATRAVELDPEDSEGWNTRGIAWWLAGDMARAVSDLQQAVTLAQPSEAEIPSDNLNRARALLQESRTPATVTSPPGSKAILRLWHASDDAYDNAA